MSDLLDILTNAGDRETVELHGSKIEMRTCRVAERLEMVRLSSIAAEAENQITKAIAAMSAQSYLIAVTARVPETGALIFDPSAADQVAKRLDPDDFELLGQAAVRVCGLDKLAQQAAKNESRASEESSIASPEISIALSKNSEDGSLHLSTVSG